MSRKDARKSTKFPALPLSAQIEAAEELLCLWDKDEAPRAFAVAEFAIFVCRHLFLLNQQHDRFISGGKLVGQPLRPAPSDGRLDYARDVFTTTGGRFAFSVIAWKELEAEKRQVIEETFGGSLLVLTANCHANHLLDESVHGGGLVLLLGNWRNYAGAAVKQVLLGDLGGLILDAQVGNATNSRALVDADVMERHGPFDAPALRYGQPYKDEEGNWPTVLLAADAKRACLVVFMAVLVCMVLPLHLKLSKQEVEYHSLAVASGGVPSIGSPADVEMPPVLTWGSCVVLGGDSCGVDVLNAAGAESLRQIVLHGLHLASPVRVAGVLRTCLSSAPAPSPTLPEPVLVACTSSLQRQAQLQLGVADDPVSDAAPQPLDQPPPLQQLPAQGPGSQAQPLEQLPANAQPAPPAHAPANKKKQKQGKASNKQQKPPPPQPTKQPPTKGDTQPWKTTAQYMRMLLAKHHKIRGKATKIVSAQCGPDGWVCTLAEGVSWGDLADGVKQQMQNMPARAAETYAIAYPDKAAEWPDTLLAATANPETSRKAIPYGELALQLEALYNRETAKEQAQ